MKDRVRSPRITRREGFRVDSTAQKTPGPPASPFRLTLGEMMLWIALVAVCLWASTVSTLLGVVAALVLVPILGRATRVVRRRAALGRPVDASTWLIAVAGSVGPVVSTWVLTVMAYLGGCWAALFLGAWLVAIFPGLLGAKPAVWAGYGVVASVGALAACVTFFTSAIHHWAIREREVGRVPGPSRHPGATGENPARAASPGG
jgi:hypothetical protein